MAIINDIQNITVYNRRKINEQNNSQIYISDRFAGRIFSFFIG